MEGCLKSLAWHDMKGFKIIATIYELKVTFQRKMYRLSSIKQHVLEYVI